MVREDRGYNKTDPKSNNLIILKRMLQSYHLVVRKSCIHRLEKNYLSQYTEQYQRKIQSTPDNSNLQKTYKENYKDYKEMKIASSQREVRVTESRLYCSVAFVRVITLKDFINGLERRTTSIRTA